MFVHFVNMKNVSKMFFLIFRTWKTLQKRILSYLFDAIKRMFILTEMKRFKNMLFHYFSKIKKDSKTCFFTLNIWKMLKNIFIHFVHKKSASKTCFFILQSMNYASKKVLIFWKNEKRSTSVFSVVKMKSLRKRVFYFDT